MSTYRGTGSVGSGTLIAEDAAFISFTPYGNLAATTVEGALQELDNEKVAKAGGTMTGALTVNAALTVTGGGSLTGTWTDLGSVTTVDINGGTIDGVTIGGAAAGAVTATALTATGAFTSLGIDDNATSTQLTIGDSAVTITPNTTFSGNVGVGISPSYNLHISESSSGAQVDAIVVSNPVGASVNTAVGIHLVPNNASGIARAASITSTQTTSGNYADLKFYTANGDTPAAALTLGANKTATFSGNVGIGSSPLTWSQGKGLNLNTYTSVWNDGGTGSWLLSNSNYNSGWKYTNSNYATRIGSSSGGIYFSVAGSGTAGNGITWTDALVIDNSSNATFSGEIIGTKNYAGSNPTSASGCSIGWNYSNGAGETTFFNKYTAATTAFDFRQLTASGTTSSSLLSISSTGSATFSGNITTTNGTITAGVNDTTAGRLNLYGPSTGNNGGVAYFYSSADYDTTIDTWYLVNYQGSFYIANATHTGAFYLNTSGNATFGGSVAITGGSFAAPAAGDALLYADSSDGLDIVGNGSTHILRVRDASANVGFSIDTSRNAAFSGNVSLASGKTLTVTGSTEPLVFVDAGSTGATEQDWIEVTCNGVTGYIRVFATK